MKHTIDYCQPQHTDTELRWLIGANATAISSRPWEAFTRELEQYGTVTLLPAGDFNEVIVTLKPKSAQHRTWALLLNI